MYGCAFRERLRAFINSVLHIFCNELYFSQFLQIQDRATHFQWYQVALYVYIDDTKGQFMDEIQCWDKSCIKLIDNVIKLVQRDRVCKMKFLSYLLVISYFRILPCLVELLKVKGQSCIPTIYSSTTLLNALCSFIFSLQS